jgi:hypothetical protein
MPPPLVPLVHGPSPFDPVLMLHATTLPPALRAQFLDPGESPHHLVLTGQMDRIWHRPGWLWPLFWLLAWIDALFPETGVAVPAEMVVTTFHRPDGQPYQVWRRTFHLKTPRYFNATMLYDSRLGRVVELVGPSGLLRVAWTIIFRPPSTIEITTAQCWVRVGHWYLAIPSWLGMRVQAIERADPARDDTIHIHLTIAQPPFGPIFGYEGTFRLHSA